MHFSKSLLTFASSNNKKGCKTNEFTSTINYPHQPYDITVKSAIMTTVNTNSINNSVNNSKFYTLKGQEVFLANRDEMDALGIEPIDRWSVDSFGIAAYSAEDYRKDIETRMTFLEDYANGYSDDYDEIYLGKVINPENDTLVDDAWILESDRREVYDELNEHGYYQGDSYLDFVLGISGYEDLLDAMFEWGSDPELIEDSENAFRVYNILRDCQATITKIDEANDWYDTDKSGLDLEDCDVRAIYEFVNGSQGSICLAKDYE